MHVHTTYTHAASTLEVRKNMPSIFILNKYTPYPKVYDLSLAIFLVEETLDMQKKEEMDMRKSIVSKKLSKSSWKEKKER